MGSIALPRRTGSRLTLVAVGVAALLLSFSGDARADRTENGNPPNGQFRPGIGAGWGVEGLHVGANAAVVPFAITASVGYNPIIISVSEERRLLNGVDFHVFHTVNLNLVGRWHPIEIRRARIGPLAGYHYNNKIGHGMSLGGEVEALLTAKLGIRGGLVGGYYPRGDEELREAAMVAPQADINFPLGGDFLFTFAVSLYWYP